MLAGSSLVYSDVQNQDFDQLVRQHATLVKRIAHHMLGRLPDSVQLDDLIQAGMIGLLEASRKYDGGKGASFETYAGIRIRGAMLDEIRRGDWAPRSVHRNFRRISDAIKQIESEKGRDAEDAEVAGFLGISQDEYHSILKDSAGCRLFSFEEVLEKSDSGFDIFEDDSPDPLDGIERDSFQTQLAEAIKTLPEREQLVLALYYDEELNLKEIGAVLGVSESRVSQLHSQAAHRLRARLGGWIS
ncbi:MAG: RNA polymerase sigma factor FliA [Oceanospirillaceae bacterium]|uniref:RNA polymerase sigma factor FliA n=1 Tax=unclassified Thalassolituus TaxID=2624967 RepID=UPI000C5D836D|nr:MULTISPECIES: RNA polymerase sigma factor FliA [unclassified Thalassolituus]MAS24134.1 RNA polymerase sigma factor FliA [Oceanospirillaceae bacterium]MAX99214.1 RNA polymerase sigma factor FliA [Oceanospirillaceae bacterium]MBL33719.1 RNA polymerase sigma factor FliA [Oceanospirillaceae bacterium]MBS51717.1 RNA polymerase sigma factor FliA [Oceanospirillaceae bacterium]|tara:strand:+ start:1802 stop:2533 length:732 start_codon:yes stop_codon:yes gene_type:complete